MTIIKNIFARLWAIWGLIIFIVTFLIIIIPAMCSHLIRDEKKSQEFFIQVARLWMNVWLALILCPLKVIGEGNFDKSKAYIVTLNHNTFLDVPITCPYVPGANKTIAKDTFAKIPLFGLFYKKGAVLVNRKSEKSRRESFYKMKEVLHQGMHICIYPEGTRNRTNEPLKTFYDGAFKLSVETGNEIIPALLFNTAIAMPNNKALYLLPKTLKIHFLKPISPVNKTAEELKKEVFEMMKGYYLINQ